MELYEQSCEQAVADALSRMSDECQSSPLAATAMTIAQRLDSTSAARDTATLARELRLTLQELATMQNAHPAEVDFVDEIKARMAVRHQSGRGAGGAA